MRLLPVLLLPGLALSGCATTLDHQAELLLHPDPVVQAPAALGALPGALAGAPVWGAVALVGGPESPAAGYALHVFAYPGALLLSVIPWAAVGPSWEQLPSD